VNFFLPFIDHIITPKFAISQRTETNFLRQLSGTSPCK